MRSLRGLLLVLTAASVPAGVVHSQQLGTVELGVFAHYTTVSGDNQLGSSSTGFGGRGGLFLFRNLEAEMEYGRGTVKTGGIRYADDAWYPVRIFGTVNLPLANKAKLLLGAGIVDTYKGDITNNEFEEGWSLLGGVRLCFGDAWSVRPEVVFDKLPSPSWMQRNYLFRPPGEGTSTRLQFRIGINRFIGRGSNSCASRSESPKHPLPPPPPAVAPVAAPAPVPAATRPSASLSASPARITAGESSTLSWTSSNTTRCAAPWVSGAATNGSQSVSPPSTTTYTTTCSGAGGTTTASATVTVSQPAPPPAAAPPPARAEPPREIFRLEGVFFDFDKATLKPAGRTKLDEAVSVLNRYPDIRVEIQGHTDSLGTVDYNMRLSERRAKTVQDYLVSKGIAASRLTTRGYGKSQPVAENGTKAGRAQNRRVVLIEIRQ